MQTNNGTDEPITSINITPLVDVALVLVIIFMITLPYLLEKVMRVNASDAKAVDISSINEPILVEILPNGLHVEGRPVPAQELAPTLKKLISLRHSAAVAVSAERAITHGKVVRVLDQVMASGAQDLSLLDPPLPSSEGVSHGPS